MSQYDELLSLLTPEQKRRVLVNGRKLGEPATRVAVVESAPANTLSITMPLPPSHLWQNRPGHWTKKREAARKYRNLAHVMARCVAGPVAPRWMKATATLAFYWPNRIRRDVRNAEAAMKPAYDGIVDAGIITDDNAEVLSHGMTTFDVDKVNPRVEITLRPAGAEGEAK